MNKKMCITGGLGFLGSYAIEKYKQEYELILIDNLSSNALQESSDLLKNVKIVKSNITDYKWKGNENFNVILHLASPVGPVGILKYAGHISKMIIDDIYWAIEGALTNNALLIYVSTSEVYGYRKKLENLKENDPKLLCGSYKVRNEYAIAKLLGEIILCNFGKTTNLKYQIIRPFNISGGRQLKNGGFVIPTFVNQSLKNEPITVFGDGTQIRSFTHAKDIIEGIDLIINKATTYNDIWNIGSQNNKISITELALKIKEKTNSSSDIVFIDPKILHGQLYEEAWDKVPDSTKIISNLGWNCKWNVDAIIDDVIKYYEK